MDKAPDRFFEGHGGHFLRGGAVEMLPSTCILTGENVIIGTQHTEDKVV